MSYKVHCLEMKGRIDQVKLEAFLNTLKGDVVAVTPHIRQIFYFIYRLECVYITEKLA